MFSMKTLFFALVTDDKLMGTRGKEKDIKCSQKHSRYLLVYKQTPKSIQQIGVMNDFCQNPGKLHLKQDVKLPHVNTFSWPDLVREVMGLLLLVMLLGTG